MPCPLLSAVCGTKYLILLYKAGMAKYTSEASVFVPNSTSEARLTFSKLNERSELISISNRIDEQSE